MVAQPPQPNDRLDALREQFWQDRDGRAVRPLHEYLALFPDVDELVVAAEIIRLERGTANEATAWNPTTDQLCRGRVLAHYELIRELGRGGQAVVWLARDVKLRREVALKFLKSAHGVSESHLRRLKKEADILSLLEHPGICSIYEADVVNGMPFIAMRYVDGVTLAQRLASERGTRSDGAEPLWTESQGPTAKVERSPVEPQPPGASTTAKRIAWCVELVESTARALHAAHEAAVVHYDINPRNIMVTLAGTPVIMDFGIARIESEEAEPGSLTTQWLGTPAYLSPEQAQKGARRLDARTDVWSLGVVLYEMLTSRRPYEGPSNDKVMHGIINDPVPSLRRINPAIPADLATIVSTSLEKDLDRRYRTAKAFADDLGGFLRHEPIAARPPGAGRRLVLLWRRRPLVVSLTALLVAVLSAGSFVIWLNNLELAARTKDAVENARIAKIETAAAVRARDAERAANVEVTLRTAIETYRHGGFDVAIKTLEGLWEEAPDRAPEIGLTLARAYQDNVQVGAAREMVGRLLQRSDLGDARPRLLVLAADLGGVQGLDGSRDDTIRAALDSGRLPDGEAEFARALIEDAPDQVVAHLTRCLASDPFHKQARFKLAGTELFTEGPEAALASVRSLSIVFGNDPSVIMFEALCYALLDRRTDMQRTLARLQGLDPAVVADFEKMCGFATRMRRVDDLLAQVFSDNTAEKMLEEAMNGIAGGQQCLRRICERGSLGSSWAVSMPRGGILGVVFSFTFRVLNAAGISDRKLQDAEFSKLTDELAPIAAKHRVGYLDCMRGGMLMGRGRHKEAHDALKLAMAGRGLFPARRYSSDLLLENYDVAVNALGTEDPWIRELAQDIREAVMTILAVEEPTRVEAMFAIVGARNAGLPALADDVLCRTRNRHPALARMDFRKLDADSRPASRPFTRPESSWVTSQPAPATRPSSAESR